MKLKRMRFNLRFPDPRGGGNFVTIHSVKELQDGLMARSIACDDLFDYFKSGQLHRWLECLAEDEAERASVVKELFENTQGKPVEEFAEGLLMKLGVEVDKDTVDDFVRGYVTSPEKFMQSKWDVREHIDAYKTSASEVAADFRKDKSWLLKMKVDLKALRRYIALMLGKFGGLSTLEEFRFVEFLKQECPLGALALLMLDEGQRYKDEHPDVFKDFVALVHVGHNPNPEIRLNGNVWVRKEHPYLISGENAPVKIYTRETMRNKWESIKNQGQQVLVIGATSCWVTNCGDSDEAHKFDDEELNGAFRLFNGLDFCPKGSAWANVVYMEVPVYGD